MIYDCFTFFNELELLELRLRTFPLVDQHILVEGTHTFWGDPKPLYFTENKERFKPWLDKIKVVVVDDMPEGNAIEREDFTRNALVRGLPSTLANSDILIWSDVDEIPCPDIVDRYLNTQSDEAAIQMAHHVSFLDWRRLDFVYRAKIMDGAYFNKMESATECRWAQVMNVIPGAGWHLSYLGGRDAIQNKVMAGSHRIKRLEDGTIVENKELTEAQIHLIALTGKFNFDDYLVKVPIKKPFLPEWVVENEKHYRDIGFISRKL